MSLAPGTRLGPYEVLSPIGAGGMGEVYRAKDARLGRDVAIKVLPALFSNDAGRRERFEREAKAVAALAHPNIINIFDTGLHDGHPFVVMELLEGETLRDRLTQGALPVRKAVEIAVQIARGLGAAHEKQIVHRDLKPENVFIISDGQVKILDFGLAREIASSSGATETRAAITDAGIAMGTVGYMAPEQIRAQSVDGRTDLFAFGAVLFEMLSGTRAFQRETSADTMTAILKDDVPDLLGANTQIPPSLDRIVRHCLEKNPAERFQSARDVAFALDALSGSASSSVTSVSGTSAAPLVATGRRWLVWTAMLVVAAIAGTAGAVIGWRRAPSAPLTVFERKTWGNSSIPRSRFMPDGKTIVFTTSSPNRGLGLYAIRPGDVMPQALPKGVELLSISSKGELAVLAPESASPDAPFVLARMALDGTPRPWLEGVTDADWAPNGVDIAIVRNVKGRPQLEYPAGTMRYAASGDELSDMRVSPDGNSVAFMEHQAAGDNRGWVKLLQKDGTVRTLAGEFSGEQGLTWTRDGSSVVFAAANQVANANFQVLEVNVSGDPRVRQYMSNSSSLYPQDVAADGSMLMMEFSSRLGMRVLLPGESTERDVSWLDSGASAFVSTDGKKVVFLDQGPGAGDSYQVAIRDIASGTVIRLGPGAVWGLSPDGKLAGAMIQLTGQNVVYPTGAGSALQIPRGPIEKYEMPPRWFADSRRTYFCGREKGRAPRCYQQNIDGGLPEPITGDDVVWARLAGDQQTLITYRTDGTFAINRIGSNDHVPVKGLKGNESPLAWSTDGTALIVGGSDNESIQVTRVDVRTGQRTILRTAAKEDANGLVRFQFNYWRPDGTSYAYGYGSFRADLYVVTRKPQ